MRKKQILGVLKAVTGLLTPNEESAEAFISLGLERLDVDWFKKAIPEWKKRDNGGDPKLYDPVPYLKNFFDYNKALAKGYLNSWWPYIEDIITDPMKLMLILERKPETIQYLNTEDGREYLKWVAQKVYDFLYDYTFE